ncbi:MAG: hypothetical protein FWE22_03930 [Firmicutes bacterium]|nr:hypothetical protein [Bacillota bacterium]
MFNLATDEDNGITKNELAQILFLCSDFRLDVIHGMLQPLYFGEGLGVIVE